MKIFAEIQRNLGNAGIGTSLSVRIAGISFPRSFVRFIIFGFIVLMGIMQGILCVYAVSVALAEVLWPLCVMVTFLSVAVIYIGLVIKTEQINEIFAFMSHIIDRRKSCIFLLL